MGPRDPVEELDLTIRAYSIVKGLGCQTVEDLARLGVRDILYHDSGRRWVLGELNDKLGALGLGPLVPGRRPDPPPAVPDVPDATFGTLGVLCPDGDAVRQIGPVVVDAWAAQGWDLVDYDTYTAMPDGPGSDMVVIQAADALASWVRVVSERSELAPAGRHPLALALSRRWPVLGVSSTEGVAYELCLYREGQPAQYAVHGRPTTPAPVETPLDFGVLADHAGIPMDAAELRSLFGDGFFFASLSGLPLGGFEFATWDLLEDRFFEMWEQGEALLFRGRETAG